MQEQEELKTYKVRVTKVAAAKDSLFPTPDSKDYVPGVYNGAVSLPVEYTVEGLTNYLPKEGQLFYLARTKRNDVECCGFFQSSRVQEVTEQGFQTRNSIYVLEVLEVS